MKRSSGVLMPVFSLPGPFGTGTVGTEAREFAQKIARLGFTYWQILPINHPDEDRSPYMNLSLFALNPSYIDLRALAEDGLLTEAELTEFAGQAAQPGADVSILEKRRLVLLRKAFARITEALAAKVRIFAAAHKSWLDAYALFTVLKNEYGDLDWNEWPGIGLRLYKEDAVRAAFEEHGNDVFFWQFVQYTAYTQWLALKEFVNKLGVSIIGDIPIYASFDSSDVWAGNDLFQLNTKHLPKRVSGVPPDYFNKNGQLWGNPLYDWDAMKKDGYAWWLSRVANALSIYDVVRIDHYRGIYSYWAVPYANKTAKRGEWVKGPGMNFIRAIHKRFPESQLIIEDLGDLSPEVKRFFADSGYPGMRVMQFGFGKDGDPAHRVKNFPADCVAYTGTHDNNTVLGWYEGASEEARAYSFRQLGISTRGGREPSGEEICKTWVGALFNSKAELAIVPVQDLLYQGSEARVNLPGTLSPANWSYRVTEDELQKLDEAWIAGLNKSSGRAPGSVAGAAPGAKKSVPAAKPAAKPGAKKAVPAAKPAAKKAKK